MKKTVALLVSLILAVTTIAPVAFASNGRYSLSHFDTFDNYIKEDESDVYPDGFRKWEQGAGASAFRGTVNSQTGSRALKVNGGGIPMFSFDTLVQEGIAHISFDIKLDDTANSKVRIMGSTTKTGSRNPYSYYQKSGDEPNLVVQNYYMDINYLTQGKINLFGSQGGHDISVWSTSQMENTLDTNWHKIDMIFDLDNHTYTPYMDGQKFVKEELYDIETGDPIGYEYYENLPQIYDLKNIYFQTSGSAPVWIDNLAAYNYERPAAGLLKAPVMKAEMVNGTAKTNGVVNVSFSEDITAASPSFTATNVATGKTFTPATVEAMANSSYKLTFASLDEGTYKVTASGITGTISELAPVSEAYFVVSATQKLNEQKLMLIDDDFADYNGGVPTGWTKLNGDNDKSAITKVAGPEEGENAVHLAKTAEYTGQSSIYHTFDNGYSIHGDNFTIEFDVNNLEAGWDIGIIRESDIAERGENTRSTKDRTDGGLTNYTQFIAYDKVENILLGSNDLNKLQVQKDAGGLRRLTSNNIVVDNLTTGWHHIKAKVNPQASTVTLTVDGIEYAAVSVPTNLFVTVVHADVDPSTLAKSNMKYYHKLKGIRINNTGANTNGVSYANVKVYKDESYNTYQDFEGRLSKNSDAGWYGYWGRGWFANNEKTYHGVYYPGYYNEFVNPYITTDTGKNGGTAIKFTNSVGYANNTQKMVVTSLSKKIEKNKAFVIEFDAKSNAAAWILYALADGTEYGANLTVGNNADSSATDTYNPEAFIVGGNSSNKLLLGSMWQWLAKTGDTGSEMTGAFNGSGTYPVAIAENEWYHYKYIVTPEPSGATSGTIKVTAVVTAPNGTQTTTAMLSYLWGAANRLRQFDTTAIGFKISGTDTTHSLSVDNLKVYQLATANDTIGAEAVVTDAYMQSVKAIGLDGEEKYLDKDEVLSANTKALEVAFSTAIDADELDKVTLLMKDGTAVGTKTLSGNVVTISFEGTALPQGDTLILTIPEGIVSGNVKTDDAHTYMFSVGNDAKIVVEDIVLYETIVGGSAGDELADCEVPTATIPVKGTTVAGTPKFILKGYNGGAATQMFKAAAEFKAVTGGTQIGVTAADTVNVLANSPFEFEIPATDVLAGDGTTVKVFAWEYPTMKPLTENYSANK